MDGRRLLGAELRVDRGRGGRVLEGHLQDHQGLRQCQEEGGGGEGAQCPAQAQEAWGRRARGGGEETSRGGDGMGSHQGLPHRAGTDQRVQGMDPSYLPIEAL